MTPETARQIRIAIAQSNDYIAKESARAADLRPDRVQKILDGHKSHRAKLLAMLAEAGLPA